VFQLFLAERIQSLDAQRIILPTLFMESQNRHHSNLRIFFFFSPVPLTPPRGAPSQNGFGATLQSPDSAYRYLRFASTSLLRQNDRCIGEVCQTIGLFAKQQRQLRILHAQKDVLNYALVDL
jgi:hypothetical protein